MTARSGPLRRQILTVIGAVALVGWSSFAAAQPAVVVPGSSPRLVLQAACGEREEAVRAAVAVEVGDLLLERGAVLAAADINDRLSLTCAGTVASIEAQAAYAATPLRRTIDLGAFPPDAAARALALAGLETLAEVSPVVQERLQRRLHDRARAVAAKTTPVVEPPVPPPAGAAAAPVTAAPRRAVVTPALAATWRRFAHAHGASLWGAQAGVERTVGERWNGGLDLDLGIGRRTTALGTVDIRTLSLGAFWEARARRGRFTGLMGVGGRAGLVNLSGHATDDAVVAGESVVRAWVGPALRARVTVGGGMWVAIAAVEGGVAVYGAEGVVNGDTAVVLRGPWLAIGAGFGIRL